MKTDHPTGLMSAADFEVTPGEEIHLVLLDPLEAVVHIGVTRGPLPQYVLKSNRLFVFLDMWGDSYLYLLSDEDFLAL